MNEKNADVIMSMLLATALLGSKEKEEAKAEVDKDKIRKTAEDIGNCYYHIYLGYKDAGFNDKQAFALVLETIRRN